MSLIKQQQCSRTLYLKYNLFIFQSYFYSIFALLTILNISKTSNFCKLKGIFQTNSRYTLKNWKISCHTSLVKISNRIWNLTFKTMSFTYIGMTVTLFWLLGMTQIRYWFFVAEKSNWIYKTHKPERKYIIYVLTCLLPS